MVEANRRAIDGGISLRLIASPRDFGGVMSEVNRVERRIAASSKSVETLSVAERDQSERRKSTREPQAKGVAPKNARPPPGSVDPQENQVLRARMNRYEQA